MSKMDKNEKKWLFLTTSVVNKTILLYCNKKDFYLFDEYLQGGGKFLYTRDGEIHFREPNYIHDITDTSGVTYINMSNVIEYSYGEWL